MATSTGYQVLQNADGTHTEVLLFEAFCTHCEEVPREPPPPISSVGPLWFSSIIAPLVRVGAGGLGEETPRSVNAGQQLGAGEVTRVTVVG